MKQHQILITSKRNDKLKAIKKHYEFNNVKETFSFLIDKVHSQIQNESKMLIDMAEEGK